MDTRKLDEYRMKNTSDIQETATTGDSVGTKTTSEVSGGTQMSSLAYKPSTDIRQSGFIAQEVELIHSITDGNALGVA